jgi:hypothetical protein
MEYGHACTIPPQGCASDPVRNFGTLIGLRAAVLKKLRRDKAMKSIAKFLSDSGFVFEQEKRPRRGEKNLFDAAFPCPRRARGEHLNQASILAHLILSTHLP